MQICLKNPSHSRLGPMRCEMPGCGALVKDVQGIVIEAPVPAPEAKPVSPPPAAETLQASEPEMPVAAPKESPKTTILSPPPGPPPAPPPKQQDAKQADQGKYGWEERIGRFFGFGEEEKSKPAEPKGNVETPLTAVSPVYTEPSREIVIQFQTGSKAGQILQFPVEDQKELKIGRETDNDVVLGIEDELTSRHHALIRVVGLDPLGFAIADLGSRNGTLLNGDFLTQEAFLKPGDAVQLGRDTGPIFIFGINPP